jgi:pyruvate,water dikinase
MSKLEQLQDFIKLDIPTPLFKGVPYENAGNYKSLFQMKNNFRFPVVVRSTFSQEDGNESSFAGHYATVLNVGFNQFEDSVRDVFKSYPNPENQQVIIQEMLNPEFSGVLFAFRNGVWKIEFSEGLGENVVSGKKNPYVLLLPKFMPSDALVAPYYQFWKPFTEENPLNELSEPFITLSLHTRTLLKHYQNVSIGLDIEFAIEKGQLYLLQARPITTADEHEEVLTSANHKEILPPKPSRAMTSLIASAKKDLFKYYQNLDPTLPDRNFIETAQGMPWINLSALLDTMVSWGLPTSLVCNSVGAEDVYKVAFRPHIMATKVKVFFRLLKEQLMVKKQVQKWKTDTFDLLNSRREERANVWKSAPAKALSECSQDLKMLYIGLVSNMQQLTGAMSAPTGILHRLGLLQKSAVNSKSTEYLKAFNELIANQMSKEDFLAKFGFRGFYESDIGQPRFFEYAESEWEKLTTMVGGHLPVKSNKRKENIFIKTLISPVIALIHAREQLRHDTMQQFWQFRKELQMGVKNVVTNSNHRFEDFYFEDLIALLQSPQGFKIPEYEPQVGWTLDTFLHNKLGRVLPISTLANISTGVQNDTGIGIYPGIIRGTVWRVQSANFNALQVPDYKQIILVADSLDPGWIPFLSKVQGVVSYVGGILSHASIILRESAIPSITQLPKNIELNNGDLIEMDGKTGLVKKLDS